MVRPHYHGHRKRLRERFRENGLTGFAEHEVVELLLTLAIPPLGREAGPPRRCSSVSEACAGSWMRRWWSCGR